ncbi:UNVERIFIED_CONTAM: hypothetical protein FKN15_066510 [Acipenser sinensis]
MDRNALAELLQALESRRDAEERRREERYTALIERHNSINKHIFRHSWLGVRKWRTAKKYDDDDILNLVKEETCDREEVLKYSCQLTLDPNTANRYLWLSEENRKVEWHKEKHPYPHHPQRFQSVPQVLCTEGLSGTRCYWEIEWSGDWVVIGVAYKGIDKLGWGL